MNRLASEKSPYLIQHADNPVDWYPWSDVAFAKARAENKAIFLSIGYSTCHWCHVMAHESFEDPATAEIMNREFVNIKVDREERPDVDRVYMMFVQATSGHGGWPMSVWLTPELKPFVGGTYFPPEDRHGHPAFKKVLQRIADAWRKNSAEIAEQGSKVIAALAESVGEAASSRGLPDASAIEHAYEQLARSYDAQEGGFGSAPKFPRPSIFNFLFRHGSERAREMALVTLRKMAAGGIHDHLGGGFARYSVDTYWHVPHFEKMLYDQAQLAIAYTEAFQITGDSFFADVARDILDYVRRDMTSPEGGFYSAEDADSLFEHGKPEHGEGAFYVWTQAEIERVLGDDAAIFCSHYGVEENGNVRPESDPYNEFDRKNVLFESAAMAETAKRFSLSEEQAHETLKRAREKLFVAREKRPRPHLDDKIITAWNGLMISAFARAAAVLNAPEYLEMAERAMRFLREQLFDEKRGILRRSYREGPGSIDGFAEDYAFVIQALLDLYSTSFDVSHVEFAERLQSTQDGLFFDDVNGGYFSVSGDDPSILLRMKEDNDGAEPSASSVAALNLLRLSELRDQPAYRERAERTIAAFAPQLERFPSALPQMLVALQFSRATPQQIVFAGDDTRELEHEFYRHFLPNAIAMRADPQIPRSREMRAVNGRAAAYVCENFTCQAPVTDPRELRALLSR
ncbi:MAG: thioredoxin domain-containing protein [Chthoniobacterales bacterium]